MWGHMKKLTVGFLLFEVLYSICAFASRDLNLPICSVTNLGDYGYVVSIGDSTNQRFNEIEDANEHMERLYRAGRCNLEEN